MASIQNDPILQVETTRGSLLYELQIIWDEVGETETDRDKMLLELERECLEVYRRKVDQANRCRAQLRQAIADAEAELAAICSAMGERPVHIRQSDQSVGSLKQELATILPELEEMQKRKIERRNQFEVVLEEIDSITNDIKGQGENATSRLLIDETDLSMRMLEELHGQLQALQKEKSDRVETIQKHLCALNSQEYQHITCNIAASEHEITEANSLSEDSIKYVEAEVVPLAPPNQSHAELVISSLLSFEDSSPFSISCTFERVLDTALASVSDDESVQDRLADRTLELASLLLDSTKRCFRKRASAHNPKSWFLPQELTIKVFSMLPTKTLMQTAACCTMFKEFRMEPLCYSHIDLTTSSRYVDKKLVSTLIRLADKELRSLKLGILARPRKHYEYLYTDPTALGGDCLEALTKYDSNHCLIGSHLQSIRLYNFMTIPDCDLNKALAVCSNITDLWIVGLDGVPWYLIQTLRKICRLIEHLFLEFYGRRSKLGAIREGPCLFELVFDCPNLTSLTLIRYELTDEMAINLIEGCRKLKYLNLSRASNINGHFLRELSCKDSPLETLILRNCPNLEEKEVLELCNSVLAGNIKSIRLIDVSSKRWLASDKGKGSKKPRGMRSNKPREEISNKPNFPVERLKEERPDVTFVVDFASTSNSEDNEEELRVIEMETILDE